MADLQRRLLLAERRLEEERDRTAALAPYRVSAPKRGVIGGSRYAKALRKAIVLAARDPTRCVGRAWGGPACTACAVLLCCVRGPAFSSLRSPSPLQQTRAHSGRAWPGEG